jgi:alpha-glucosidase
MTTRISRRRAIGYLGAASAALVVPPRVVWAQPTRLTIAGKPAELAVAAGVRTVRVMVRPIVDGAPAPIPPTGAVFGRFDNGLMLPAAGARAGDAAVRFTGDPPTIHIDRRRSGGQTQVVQRLAFDAAAPGVSFLLPKGPLLGLGEGGVQFDRKGSTDEMRNGQVNADADGYRLAINGTRAPIQWLVGTDGWALFIHQPYGAFDFKGADGRFTPRPETPLPLDIFVVTSSDPIEIMREYAAITGLPEMPPLWAFGYQQSSRTLGGPEEILGIARTFRGKKLPCDTLIYLGTEFAPSGWNTRNGEFTWHPTNFPDPKKMMETLHDQHFRVVVHVVIEGRQLTGTVADPCTAEPLPSGRTPDDRWPPVRQVSCYWPAHKAVLETGVDGWWPDQGDGFDGPSRFNRHRMYWEGTQLYRPNERPFALHRNASAGVQRFGGFIWSGDVQSRWETLKTHVPVAINTALSGLPYWGTDIGGFNPTPEYTAELHVRWFQFGAFNPLFRAHGRNWHLRLPWGWDGGDGGPFESGQWRVDPAELKRPEVETICRKYLELRYRLMPYLQTALRECHDTGLPIMRALWLHYPDDPAAVARGDEYLWGRDILVAPVVEKGATSRKLYLPRGDWIDYWTEEHVAGGREIERAVDLATMPLYVRAGAVVPFGPVKQYVDEPSDAPLTLLAYPGADGSSTWYEDDGQSFAYRKGEWMRVTMTWRQAARELSLALASGARMRPPAPRAILVRIAGAPGTKTVTFDGRPIRIAL